MDGESILPLMMGEKESNGRTEVFCEYHNHFYTHRQRMVRDLDYQLTFNESERGELYDLKKDPYQLKNVCYDPAYADVKKKYMDILINSELYMSLIHMQLCGCFVHKKET